MPIIAIILGAGLLFWFASRQTPGGISQSAKKKIVPVMLGDNVTITKATAEWHATNDQNNLFGPRAPAYWNLNGYFMFPKASGSGYDLYKPDWAPKIIGTYV